MTVDEVMDLLLDTLLLDIDGPDDDLIDSGELDSLRFVELILAVESRYGVRVDVSELRLDDLRTPNRIAATVQSLLARTR